MAIFSKGRSKNDSKAIPVKRSQLPASTTPHSPINPKLSKISEAPSFEKEQKAFANTLGVEDTDVTTESLSKIISPEHSSTPPATTQSPSINQDFSKISEAPSFEKEQKAFANTLGMKDTDVTTESLLTHALGTIDPSILTCNPAPSTPEGKQLQRDLADLQIVAQHEWSTKTTNIRTAQALVRLRHSKNTKLIKKAFRNNQAPKADLIVRATKGQPLYDTVGFQGFSRANKASPLQLHGLSLPSATLSSDSGFVDSDLSRSDNVSDVIAISESNTDSPGSPLFDSDSDSNEEVGSDWDYQSANLSFDSGFVDSDLSRSDNASDVITINESNTDSPASSFFDSDSDSNQEVGSGWDYQSANLSFDSSFVESHLSTSDSDEKTGDRQSPTIDPLPPRLRISTNPFQSKEAWRVKAALISGEQLFTPDQPPVLTRYVNKKDFAVVYNVDVKGLKFDEACLLVQERAFIEEALQDAAPDTLSVSTDLLESAYQLGGAPKANTPEWPEDLSPAGEELLNEVRAEFERGRKDSSPA
jgi:hypothetical protein